MTDIDKVEAGPELDALVAEKVMGWKLHIEERGPHMGEIAPDGKLHLWIEGRVSKWNVLHWKPSRDIAAAWEVIEQLQSKGIRLDSLGHGNLDCHLETTRNFSCEFGGWAEDGSPTISWSAIAKTAPVAICRAAFKAVGAQAF